MSKHSKSIWNNWKIWAGLIGIILIILVVLIIINNLSKEVSSNSTEKYNMIGTEIKLTNKLKKEMYEKAKEDITKGLKTPSTAIFPEIKEWNIDVNYNNVIVVKSYVDSQNSYGAMLRAYFEQKYIISSKNEYICIYKEFNNDIEFDITEKTEYKRFINEEVFDFQMKEFIEKSKNSTIYGSLIDYKYNKDSQDLEINILVNPLKEEDYKYYINASIIAYINQCICIPTVNTKLNIKNTNGDDLAIVSNINFKFLLEDWYILLNLGIMDTSIGIVSTDLNEKLQNRLWLNDSLK